MRVDRVHQPPTLVQLAFLHETVEEVFDEVISWLHEGDVDAVYTFCTTQSIRFEMFVEKSSNIPVFVEKLFSKEFASTEALRIFLDESPVNFTELMVGSFFFGVAMRASDTSYVALELILSRCSPKQWTQLFFGSRPYGYLWTLCPSVEYAELLIKYCPMDQLRACARSPKRYENVLVNILRNSNVRVVRYLFDRLAARNVDMGILLDSDQTLLHHASRYGGERIDSVLANYPVNRRNSAFGCDDQGQNPLHWAAEWSDTATLERLLEAWPAALRGLRFRPDHLGRTPFHVAGWERDGVDGKKGLPMMKLILEHCQQDEIPGFYQPDAHGYTPLHWAACDGNIQLCTFILESCPQSEYEQLFANYPHLQSGSAGEYGTPFHMAAAKGNVEVMTLLIQRRRPEDVAELFGPVCFGNTAFHHAVLGNCKERRLETMKRVLYLSPSAIHDSFFAPNDNGQTPFHLAANQADGEAMQFIWDRCPEQMKEGLWLPSKDGYTVLRAWMWQSAGSQLYMEWVLKILNMVPSEVLEQFYLGDFAQLLGDKPAFEQILQRVGDKGKFFDLLVHHCAPAAYKYYTSAAYKRYLSLLSSEEQQQCLGRNYHGYNLLQFFALQGQYQRIVETFRQCDKETCLRLLLVKNKSGISAFDIWIDGPYECLEMFAELHTLGHPLPPSLLYMLDRFAAGNDREKKLLNLVFIRTHERFPRFGRSMDELKHIPLLVDTVLSCSDDSFDFLTSSLEWDFKMNQRIPLTAKSLKRLLDLERKVRSDRQLMTIFRLALQTHPVLNEIEIACRGESEADLLCRAQVLRQRAYLPKAQKILKEALNTLAWDRALLLYSLKLIGQTQIPSSSKTIERLLAVIDPASPFESELKVEACGALAQVEHNPLSKKRKIALFGFLNVVNPQDNLLQKAVLECLKEYVYESHHLPHAWIDLLLKIKSEAKDPQVLRALGFLLSVMPNRRALKEALTIVNSSSWDPLDKGMENRDRIGFMGSYLMYNYRQKHLHNRRNMKRSIVERLLSLAWSSLENAIIQRYTAYRGEAPPLASMDCDSEPIFAYQENVSSLCQLEENLARILSYQYSIRDTPMRIHYPDEQIILRGLCTRKGAPLLDHAVDDLMMKGVGSADLTFYKNHTDALWAKVHQFFFSIEIDKIHANYFVGEGALIGIQGRQVNEAQLRGNVRQEIEDGLNPVMHSRIPHKGIAYILLAEKFHRRNENHKDTFVGKIARRALSHAGMGFQTPLSKRTRLYSDSNAIKRIITRRRVTRERLIEVNIKRQIGRELMAHAEPDPDLKACIEEVLPVHPLCIGM